ncbi:arsenite methyltransferase [Candidatus Bathyarchaeota archaeon]|nr:arsenite methyltransferase [Candidatus Bathyarchaeota archaeon]
MDEIKIKEKVRKYYAQIAKKQRSCCSISCRQNPVDREKGYEKLGYAEEELKSLPEDVFSLGCGKVELVSIKEGGTVLDLGSGSGFDCFLASKRVGEDGKIIGVDMAPEMINRAREAARKGNYKNMDFILGDIEKLPVADNSVDVVISNCVINLSPNKKRVFDEAFRVIKSCGRLMISDIVLLSELPKVIRESELAYVGCISGAALKEEYLEMIKSSGFKDIEVVEEIQFSINSLVDELYVKEYEGSTVSIKIYGIKP